MLKMLKICQRNLSIIKDFVEEHTKIFLPRILDYILMGKLNDILLEAFEKILRHRRALS